MRCGVGELMMYGGGRGERSASQLGRLKIEVHCHSEGRIGSDSVLSDYPLSRRNKWSIFGLAGACDKPALFLMND